MSSDENTMLTEGILSGDILSLSKGITLIESASPRHFNKARDLVDSLFAHSGRSVRIGVSGPPGVGKSSFIESFGLLLCDNGHKVAVLAIDPSSNLSHGAVLGDKTRMEKLSMHPDAYIRPTATGSNLGGVHGNTREAIILCEAAGYDIILIETVGVGQNETAVREMTDIFLLLVPPGGGDELQGIKRGIMETCDMVVVNKADMNKELAKVTAHDYANAMHLLNKKESLLKKKAVTVSAIENQGIKELWESIDRDLNSPESRTLKEAKRKKQLLAWFETAYKDSLITILLKKYNLSDQVEAYKADIENMKTTPLSAAYNLLQNNNL